jgi:tRNA pseudouridine38-40 synthase
MRLALAVEYAGFAFCGFQSQPSRCGVQDALEAAIGEIAGHPVGVVAAGRTDAGVHALGQVAHFDTTAERSPRSWTLGANTQLPVDVAVLWAMPVAGDFHARYSALARTYRYVIQNRSTRPALARARVCWVHEPLDAAAMHAAAQVLVGEHDYSSFRAAECQSRTPLRRLGALRVWREGERVCLEVTANAFLHHMVRNIAGTLIAVGTGERPAAWVRSVLEARDRRVAGVTAPAGGLYLLRVDYPPAAGLPAVAATPAWAMIPGA